jgi:hypothetical protein
MGRHFAQFRCASTASFVVHHRFTQLAPPNLQLVAALSLPGAGLGMMPSMQDGIPPCTNSRQGASIMKNQIVSDLFESTLLLGVGALFAMALFSDLKADHIAEQSLVAQQANAVVAVHHDAARQA